MPRCDPAAESRPRDAEHLHPGGADHADRIITKHGILLVEFANQRRDDGLSIRDAIVQPAKVRLRPILMTTAALALAVVPLILAEGARAAGRQAMGLVIFTGLMVGTLFTLFVVPMFYTIIASASRGERRAQGGAANRETALPAPAE